MMMRDMRSLGICAAILAAAAVATGCGGQPADVGESDIDTTIEQDEAQHKASDSSTKKSPLSKKPSLDPLAGGTVNALPQNKLLASDGAPYDAFGVSVGISGTTAVVGSIFDNAMGTESGSAYVFVEDNGVWTEQAKLVAKDGRGYEYFGISVAASGDRIIVGAVEAGTGTVKTGAAYIFERVSKTWSLVAKLTPAGGVTSDYFGYSVAIEGNIAVIGAPQADSVGFDSGAAYVFKYNGTTWNQAAKLQPLAGGVNMYFGSAVALSGTTALVSQWDDGTGDNMGSVIAFKESGTAWPAQTELKASDREKDDVFGYSLAIHNNKAIIGSPYRDADCTDSGAVYVYGRYNDEWCEEQIIIPNDKNAAQAFGSSVGLWGDMAAIGSYWDEDNGAYSGSAYAYRNIEGVWTEQFKYSPTDGNVGQLFGFSASMDADRVIVGAYGDDDIGTDSGAAYAFSVLQDPNSPAPAPLVNLEINEEEAAAAGAQCTLHAAPTSSQSPWFIGLGLTALGLRRLARKTRKA